MALVIGVCRMFAKPPNTSVHLKATIRQLCHIAPVSWVKEMPTYRLKQIKETQKTRDVMIKYAENTDFNYTLSDFFRHHDAMEASVPGLHEKLDRFIRVVDKRVKIDTSEPRHKDILHSVKRFVQCVCGKLEMTLPQGTGTLLILARYRKPASQRQGWQTVRGRHTGENETKHSPK